jgi:hypothetical protein
MLIFAVTGFAQENATTQNDGINSVFGNNQKVKLGWMVGGSTAYTQFDGKDVWMAGLSAGLIIDHNFTIGITGRSWCNRDEVYFPNAKDTTGAYLEGGYGGLLLEYTLFPKSVVHVTFPVMIGAGGLTYTSRYQYTEWDEDEWDTHYKSLGSDAFFIVEPGIMAEVTIFKFMRLDAGVGYRYTAGLDLINTPDNLLNNFTAAVGLKFGKF